MRPVNGGGEKNEDGTAQQHGSTGEMHGGWSKPDLVAWARKLGIDKLQDLYPHLGSCQRHVTTGYLLLHNKATVQMQMRVRDRNENKMHIIKKEARRGRDEHQSRWLDGSDGSSQMG